MRSNEVAEMTSNETWTLLGVAWNPVETKDPHRVAVIFEESDHVRDVCPCPLPGVTLLAYRSASGALDDALRVISNARARAVAVTGECEEASTAGFGNLSRRLYSLLETVPEGVAICALSTFESVRHNSNSRFVCSDLGPVGLSKIGGRERVFHVSEVGASVKELVLDRGERAIDTLPSQFGYFVGRKAELDRAFRYLECERNVTITGVTGIGKSHFACRAAREIKGDYGSGAAWASLDQAANRSEIMKCLAKGLGVEGFVDAFEAVRRIIVEEPLLLVLDGVNDCAEPLRSMLENDFRGAASQIIATAESPIGYAGEAVVALSPMPSVPPDISTTLDELNEFDASALFLDRLGELNEGLIEHLDPREVASLTRALGGHPQSICLAAAQTRFESVSMILANLDRGRRRPDYRQAIARSLAEMPELARSLAHALSVCETPISTFQLARLVPDHAGNACALDFLRKVGLCGESISSTGRVVYELYPSVKMHLRKSRLPGISRLRRLHESLFLEVAKDAVEGYSMAASAGDLDLAEEHAADIFAAMRSTAKNIPTERFYEVVRSVFPFLYDHNHIDEGLEILEQKVGISDGDDDLAVAKLLNTAGVLAAKAGRPQLSRQLCETGLRRLEGLDDGLIRAALISTLAAVEWSDGNPELARDQFKFAIELFRHVGREDHVIKALVSSVTSHIECGDVAAAESAFAVVEASWESPTPLQQWCIQLGRGQIEWARGRPACACRSIIESIRVAKDMKDDLSLLRSLVWLSQALCDNDDARSSTVVLAVAAHNRTETTYRLYRNNEIRVERVRQRLIAALGETRFRTEFISGSVQGLDDVLASIC